MKKHELIAERNALRRKLNDQDIDYSLKQLGKESQLVRLGLIPDKYVREGGPFSKRIDWYQIGRDLKDLEAYEAAERGRKIAGVEETTIEVNMDTCSFQETLKKAVERTRRTKPRKPWLDAKNGEAWVIDVDGYPEPLAVIVDGARFETHMAAIDKTDPRITAGRRIWPEAGDDQ